MFARVLNNKLNLIGGMLHEDLGLLYIEFNFGFGRRIRSVCTYLGGKASQLYAELLYEYLTNIIDRSLSNLGARVSERVLAVFHSIGVSGKA